MPAESVNLATLPGYPANIGCTVDYTVSMLITNAQADAAGQEEPYPIPDEGGPEGDPTETLEVQWTVQAGDTDIATTAPSLTAVPGSTLKIDDEYMTVVDATNRDNLEVTRGSCGTLVLEHEEGAAVEVWGTTLARSRRRRL